MSDNFKVLLVDDESMVRMSISTFAKKAQIAIDTASNGLEAIQKIKDNTYTFVLMDLLMPEMDGKKATAEIKAIPGKENTKIVAMSAGKLDIEFFSIHFKILKIPLFYQL